MTFFFKPNNEKMPSNHIEFQKKNFSLKSNNSLKPPSVFSTKKFGIREEILKSYGFQIHSKMGIHNLFLTPYFIGRKFKKKINQFIINKYQKINRFFSFEEYNTKSLLYINYKIYKNKYPSDYNYMLESYSYPEEKDIIETKFKNYTFKNKKKDIWMVKPNIGLGGFNISILNNFSSIKFKHYIITKYLENPYLIRGFKFDIRFHGLISTIKPLKLYLYKEGFVRLASEKHNFSSSLPLNKFAFLTNLDTNKLNKGKYKYPVNSSNIEDSNLWNLNTLRNYCERNGVNYTKIFNEVADIFIKAIISVRKKIKDDFMKNNMEFSNFYHLIGFDIILDDKLRPYLLEMNRVSGFRDNNDAEKYYVYNIFADTLNIVGIVPKELMINARYKDYKEELKDNLEENLCELDRPRGGYQLIFPKKKNIEIFKKFFGKNISKEDKLLWKHLFE